MINTDWISTVKDLAEGGWLVNGEMFVPNTVENRHGRSVLEWIGEGNTPDEADAPPAPLTTRQQIIARIQNDEFARAQARETRDRLGLNNSQMLDLLVAKADGS